MHGIYHTVGFRYCHGSLGVKAIQSWEPMSTNNLERRKHRHWEESKISKRRQCYNQQGVGYESGLAKIIQKVCIL